MNSRLTVIGAVTAVVLAFAIGLIIGHGTARPAGAWAPMSMRGFVASGQWGDAWSVMDAMHDSPQMRAMHQEMPAEWQARCDAMHEQIQQRVGSSELGPGMMGGPGMMSGQSWGA